jgi:hypothetical protein
VEIQSLPIAATGDKREPWVVETQAVEEGLLQLDQNHQMPGNVETPIVDRNRTR